MNRTVVAVAFCMAVFAMGAAAQTVTGSGTTNTVPVFTGASTVGNSPITVSGSNVGIGAISSATKPVIDVTHPLYGAIGNGVNDDTSAIALAASVANAAGGILYIPRTGHNFLTSAPVVLTNADLWHEGSLRGTTANQTSVVQVGTLTAQSVNHAIYGHGIIDTGNLAQRGINLVNFKSEEIRDIQVNNMASIAGIDVGSAVIQFGTGGATIHNINLTIPAGTNNTPGAAGILIDNATDNDISTMTIAGYDKGVINNVHGNIRIDDIHVYGFGLNGGWTGSNLPSTCFVDKAGQQHWDHDECDTPTVAGFEEAGYNATVDHFYCYNNTTWGLDNVINCIVFDQTEPYATVTNARFTGYSGHRILADVTVNGGDFSTIQTGGSQAVAFVTTHNVSGTLRASNAYLYGNTTVSGQIHASGGIVSSGPIVFSDGSSMTTANPTVVTGSNQISQVNGNVGIGTTSPTTLLNINGTAPTFRIHGITANDYTDLSDSNSNQFTLQKFAPSGATLIDVSPVPLDGVGAATMRLFRATQTTGPVSFSIMSGDGSGNTNSNLSGNGNSTLNAITGNVGIGTANPGSAYKLDVSGQIHASGGIVSSGPIVFSDGSSMTTANPTVVSGSNQISQVSGNVGIGTTNPTTLLNINGTAPIFRIHGATANDYTDLSDSNSNQFTLQKFAPSGAALIDVSPIPADGASAATMRLFRATQTTGPVAFSILSGDGSGNMNSTLSGNGNSTLNAITGNVGIGTWTPGAPLHVLQNSYSAGFAIVSNFDVANNLGGSNYTRLQVGQVNTGAVFLDSYNQTNVKGNLLLLPWGGSVGIGTANPQAKLEINGNLRFTADGSVQTTAWTGTLCGGDYAESVDVTGNRTNYEPGDVLVLDADNPGKILKSIEAYSTSVSGVYSTKPGTVGRRQATAKSSDEVPMAVIGIVPAKVSAENGPIKVGDLLVTSSTPGYAMKGTDRGRMLGAIVGKAMAKFDSGAGVIEVLVTLQ